ncbi:shikimate kinase [Candidatus Woesearchaeota archaeon]|nr:shikimate kinase [Candidatus Woesearchaeota archaeon]
MNSIVLIGFKGCGKSTVGRLLADRLGCEFYDIDNLIEEEYKRSSGEILSFRQIFKKSEEIFRKLEKKALERLAAIKGSSMVVSTGGSTPLDKKNQDIIKEIGMMVYICADPDIIYERIIKNGIPAFFDEVKPRKSFDELLAERDPVYKRISDIIVDNSEDADSSVCRIIEILKERGQNV